MWFHENHIAKNVIVFSGTIIGHVFPVAITDTIIMMPYL